MSGFLREFIKLASIINEIYTMIDITILIILHKIFAVIWLGMIPADILIRSFLLKGENPEQTILANRGTVSIWLKLLNITGMIGMTGLLITGILAVLRMPGYGFFQFAGGQQHWLATKQLLTVVLIVITGAVVIPTGRKIRLALAANPENDPALLQELVVNIRKLAQFASIIGILIALNYLLAVTRFLFIH
jgi:hypothetical protein